MLDAAALHAAADQAAGLRHLFAARGTHAQVVAGVAPRGPAAAAIAIAGAALDNGEGCLIVDATRGEVAIAAGRAARYELRHAMRGEIGWREVVIENDDGIRVLPAARGFAMLLESPHPGARLADIAHRTGHAGDRIVIAVGDHEAELAAALLPGSDIAIACAAGPRARMGAYALMKRLAARGAAGGFRLLVDGARHAEGACELADVAGRFLDLPVGLGADLTDPRQLAASIGGWTTSILPSRISRS